MFYFSVIETIHNENKDVELDSKLHKYILKLMTANILLIV